MSGKAGVKVTRVTTRVKTASRTSTKGTKGNHSRCPVCGKFMGSNHG